MSATGNRAPGIEPVYNVTSVFTAHRDLKQRIRAFMVGSHLTVDEADILILLYGLRHLGWDDCPVRPDGYVAIRHLKSILVHDPSLFTRRIASLMSEDRGYIETSREADMATNGIEPKRAVHGNAKMARITEAGVEAVLPVWQKFEKLSESLFASPRLKHFTPEQLRVHQEINEAISASLRESRDPGRVTL